MSKICKKLTSIIMITLMAMTGLYLGNSSPSYAVSGNLKTDIESASPLIITTEGGQKTLVAIIGANVDHTSSCLNITSISLTDNSPTAAAILTPVSESNNYRNSIITPRYAGTVDLIIDGNTSGCSTYNTQSFTGAKITIQVKLPPAQQLAYEYLNGSNLSGFNDSTHTMYTSATWDNYKNILNGQTAYNALTDTERNTLNNAMTNAGGPNYPTLAVQAMALKTRTDTFKSQYESDPTSGKKYTKVNLDNAQQIVNGLASLTGESEENKIAIAGSDYTNFVGAAQWTLNNEDILSDDNISGNELTDIESALTSYRALPTAQQTLVSDSVNKLNAQKGATQWVVDNNPILSEPYVDNMDTNTIQAALDSLVQLNTTERRLVSPDLVASLQNKKIAAQWYGDNETIIKKKTASRNDIPQIKAALDSYAQMTPDEKAQLDPDVIKDLRARSDASNWLDANHVLLNKALNTGDMIFIKHALETYKLLSPEAQAYLTVEMTKLNEFMASVKTGDSSNMLIWLAVMTFAAACGICTLTYIRKREV